MSILLLVAMLLLALVTLSYLMFRAPASKEISR